MSAPVSSFADLGLPVVLVQSLRRAGLAVPFPIQASTIPQIRAGRDVLGRAPTGSGKTLAFGLPMLTMLAGKSSKPSRPRGLVMAPTRELALQIEASLDDYSALFGLKLIGLVGGVPLKRHVDRIARGVDIAIATPGRLMDLIEHGTLDLSDVSITAIDEADRMSDLGFLPQVEKILKATPPAGQRLLFSATLDGDVDVLVRTYLRTPAVSETAGAAGLQSTPAVHYFLRVTQADKQAVAVSIGAREGRTIMFVRTRHAVDRLTDELRRHGVHAAALHGDKSQHNRTHTLASFADGSVPVLVATDVAARGLHVDEVSLVVHVDPPLDGKDYVHRAGRTARAGDSGTVVTLTTDDQESVVLELARSAGIEGTTVVVHPGASDLARITGARKPTGIPVVLPAKVAAPVVDSGFRRRSGAPPRSTGGRSRRGGRR